MDPASVATTLLDAFNDGEVARMRGLLHSSLAAWATDADEVAQAVTGADAYLDRIVAMNLPAVGYRVTQPTPPSR